MKKVVILRFISFVTFVIFFSGINILNAQEIEVTNDFYYLKTKDHQSKIYGRPSGEIWLAGRPSNMFTIITDNANIRAFRVINDWQYNAFEVYGSGVVKVMGIAIESDSTVKEEISSLGTEIDKLKKINAVKYKLKTDEKRDGKEKKTHYGFLAQDLEKIYPDMIFTNEEGIKSIFYTELIPVLLEAVKTQQAEIESQNKQLLEIEKRLAKLELKKSK